MMQKPIATTRSATGMPTGRLAVWWLIASEVVIFGGLLAAYLMQRFAHPEWADAALRGSCRLVHPTLLRLSLDRGPGDTQHCGWRLR